MKSIEIPTPAERDWRYRTFEILPGVLSWSILFLPLILSQVSAKLTAYFVIAYLLLWFMRAVGLNIRSLQGWRMMNQHRSLNWTGLNDDLENLEDNTADAPKWHAANVQRVKERMDGSRVKPGETLHAFIVAAYNESEEILEPTIKSVAEIDFDTKKVILIIAYEERGGPAVQKVAEDLIEEYGQRFYWAAAVRHPKDIPGEITGKGGNITYAGRRLKNFLEEKNIDPGRILVTTLDSDTRPDRKYLGALTYTFCSTEEPKYISFQPIPMYLNNIWDAPAPMRVIATGNSFWMVVQSLRPHMLRNFSAHAQLMQTLIDTDFWSVRTVVEDGHQFWRTYFRYDGKHDVYPIFVPIYQDAVLTEKYLRTLKAQFIQVRRWAWGVSDIAYVFYTGFIKKNKVPKKDLITKFLRLFEGHLSWATAPLLLAFGAFLPLLFNPQSYIANELPRTASRVETIAMVGIATSLFLSFRTLPPKPARYRRHRTLFMIVQWVYLPLTTIIFSAFAALNSQTRLIFGKYLGKFDVTEKAVRK